MHIKRTMEIFVEQPNEPVGKNFSPAHKSNRDNMAESGLAAKTWHKEMSEVAKLFSQFKVYDFMQDMYEEFHVQGDNTTFDAFKDTSTKCFNHITGSRHCNFNLQPMRMNRRYLDRRFWRLKEPMIK